MPVHRPPGCNPTGPASACHRLTTMLVLGVVALGAILLAACGSGGSEQGSVDETTPAAPGSGQGLSMQEYYDRLQESFEKLSLAANNSAPKDLTSTDQLLPFLKDSLSEFAVAMTAFADEVEALKPPPSMADAHSEFASALRSDAEATAELAENVRGSDSLAEATEAFASRDTTLLRSREPCRALQDIAVQAGITAALPCDE